MAYAPHLKTVFGGFLGSTTPGAETWSCSLRWSDLTMVTNQADADTVLAYAQSMINTAYFDRSVYVNFAKTMKIDATGHVEGDVFVSENDGTVHGSGTQNNPWQSALVVSLRTGLRGPSRRGRFYLPNPAVPSSSATGEIDDTYRNNVEDAVHTFLVGLSGGLTNWSNFVVASQKGYSSHIVGFNIGRVIDTQRRRRRSLDEAYGALVAIPNTP